MTEYLSKQAIRAREYAGRTDLTEVILADAVEKVGEGAFSRCTALARVTVGRGVREIGPEAFTNLPANAGFVWLSRTLYRSPFMRILPPFSRVGWIAAPYAPFAGRPFEEQLVLALGFLLCPELEELYPEEKRSACRDFLFAELRKDPSARREALEMLDERAEEKRSGRPMKDPPAYDWSLAWLRRGGDGVGE